MTEAKLLVINLQDPAESMYFENPKNAVFHLMGYDLSSRPLFVVRDSKMYPIIITNYEFCAVQDQINRAMRPTQENNS